MRKAAATATFLACLTLPLVSAWGKEGGECVDDALDAAIGDFQAAIEAALDNARDFEPARESTGRDFQVVLDNAVRGNFDNAALDAAIGGFAAYLNDARNAAVRDFQAALDNARGEYEAALDNAVRDFDDAVRNFDDDALDAAIGDFQAALDDAVAKIRHEYEAARDDDRSFAEVLSLSSQSALESYEAIVGPLPDGEVSPRARERYVLHAHTRYEAAREYADGDHKYIAALNAVGDASREFIAALRAVGDAAREYAVADAAVLNFDPTNDAVAEAADAVNTSRADSDRKYLASIETAIGIKKGLEAAVRDAVRVLNHALDDAVTDRAADRIYALSDLDTAFREYLAAGDAVGDAAREFGDAIADALRVYAAARADSDRKYEAALAADGKARKALLDAQYAALRVTLEAAQVAPDANLHALDDARLRCAE